MPALTTAAFELPREATEQFAEMTDYFRDYRDCADMYSERDKFEIYDEFQRHIDALLNLEVSLRYATRKVAIKSAIPDAKPFPTSVLYVIAFPLGKEPSEFATARAARIGW